MFYSFYKVITFLFLLLMSATPVFAIPTPDVLINLVVSISTIIGALATTGIGVFIGGKNSRKKGGETKGRQSSFLIYFFTAAVAMNAYQYISNNNENVKKKSTNLFRDSVEDGQIVKDEDLKQLSMSSQLTHAQGLSTTKVFSSSIAKTDPTIIDVREPEEFEAGHIKGAINLRYPDILKNPSIVKDISNEPIFICWSGNRSGELAGKLAARGLSPHFMVGGYKKWVNEGRKLQDQNGEESGRSILDYNNRDILLETTQAVNFYNQGDVVFIDTRYPTEYNFSHLPGAINIPVRKLLSHELEEEIRKLDTSKSYIGLGYDKRSSFYSMILGAKLSKNNISWLGRYTTPHEFSFIHVVEQKKQGLLNQLYDDYKYYLLTALMSINEKVKSMVVSIFFFVVLLRLVHLPFKARADHLDLLFKKTGTQHRHRPMWGFLSAIVQLALFIPVFFVIKELISSSGAEPFLWVLDISLADSLRLFPVFIGLGAIMQMATSAREFNKKFFISALLGGILFSYLTWNLPVAVNVYIAINLTLGMLQFALHKNLFFKTSVVEKSLHTVPRDIVTLKDAHLYDGIGAKALNNSIMVNAGIPVPSGFVLSPDFLKMEHSEFDDVSKESLMSAFKALGAKKVSVRSSAIGEDGVDKSFAGIFDTMLNVSESGFLSSINEVNSSFSSARAKAYGTDSIASCILVQEMVNAEYAGVIFTKHPQKPSRILLESVKGLGEGLVSGTATPMCFEYSYRTGELLESSGDFHLDFSPLLKYATQIEDIFGQGQDIEWAYAKGNWYILQARPITMQSGTPALEVERERLLNAMNANSLWSHSGVAELLPTPTESSLSLIRQLYSKQGALGRALEYFSLPVGKEATFDDYIKTAFGRLFLNKNAERKMFNTSGVYGVFKTILASFNILRERHHIYSEFEEDFLPEYLKYTRLEASRDLMSLNFEDLQELLKKRTELFTNEHYPWAEKINIIADFQIRKGNKIAEQKGISKNWREHFDFNSITYTGNKLLRRVGNGELSLDEYLGEFGHRAPMDYELSAPRYSENRDFVMDQALDMCRTEDFISRKVEKVSKGTDLGNISNKDMSELRLSAIYDTLKETSKHYLMKEVALIRDVYLALGERLNLGDQVFHFAIDEMLAIESLKNGVDLAIIAQHRSARRDILCELNVPFDLTSKSTETLFDEGQDDTEIGDIKGKFVSGDESVISGVARIVNNAEDLKLVRPGEIVITRYADATITPLFSKVAGLVTEVGGVVSHAAIVAREYNLPAVFGAKGATSRINSGDRVTIEPDGNVRLVAL